MTNQTITIESEMKRRTDLFENVEFRKLCINAAKKLGITAKEWNENKAMLCLYFANEMCRIENENNKLN